MEEVLERPAAGVVSKPAMPAPASTRTVAPKARSADAVGAPSPSEASGTAEAAELWSVRLSLLGAALAVPAIASLIVPSMESGNLVHVASYTVYGIGLQAMFLASAAFHAKAGRERTFLKNIDYCAIALMIAGNFTPYCTVALGTPFAISVIAVVWAIALAAIILRISRPRLDKKVFIFSYLAMGWLGMLIGIPLVKALGWTGAGLLVLGGVIYTAGTLIFNRYEGDVEPPGFGPHDVWHIFILAGAGIHYLVFRLYFFT